MLDRANNQIRDLTGRVNRLEPENERLRSVERDYNRVRRVLGSERANEIVWVAKEQESIDKEKEIATRNVKRHQDNAR